MPEEALWLLGHPALPSRRSTRGRATGTVAGRVRRAARHRLLRVAVGARRPPRHRRRPARLPERRPRARRRVVADAHGARRAAADRSAARRATPPTPSCAIACDRPRCTTRDARRSAAVARRAGRFTGRTSRTDRVRRWRTNEGFDYFDGSHDGYRPIDHRRHVLALHGDLLVVADLVERRRRSTRRRSTGISIRGGT